MTTPASFQAAAHFYPSTKSPLAHVNYTLWLLITALLAGLLWSGFNASVVIFCVIALPLLLPFAIAGALRLRRKQPFLSIDEQGIHSRWFKGKTKQYCWPELSQLHLHRKQNIAVLELTRVDGKKHSLPLNTLDQPGLQQLGMVLQRRQDGTGITIDDQHSAGLAFMTRLQDEMPVLWVSGSLIALNIAIWLLTTHGGAGINSASPEQLLAWGGNATSEVQRGEWWRLLSATVLHSGFMHVAMNMLGLYSAGALAERLFGHRRFLLIYLGSGLVGSALSLHYAAQQAVSVGASGAVFGATGALLLAIWRQRRDMPADLRKQHLYSLSLFIVYALLQGFGHRGIDNAAHIGGLLSGMALAALLPLRGSNPRSNNPRTLLAVLLTAISIIALTLSAAPARVDQKLRISNGIAMKQVGTNMDQALAQLKQDIAANKAGTLSDLALDDRNRSIHGPAMAHIARQWATIKMPAEDPRAPLLHDMQRMAQLLDEALNMPSIYLPEQHKIVAADPQRMAVIQTELTALNQSVVDKAEKLKAAPAK